MKSVPFAGIIAIPRQLISCRNVVKAQLRKKTELIRIEWKQISRSLKGITVYHKRM